MNDWNLSYNLIINTLINLVERILKRDLKVMDVSAVSLCKDNKIPLFVFDFEAKDGIAKILQGENIGTYVGE